MVDDGDLGARNDDRCGTADRACRSFDPDENGRGAAVVLEDLGAVETPDSPARGGSSAQLGLDFPFAGWPKLASTRQAHHREDSRP
jgi:hypothetical protein